MNRDERVRSIVFAGKKLAELEFFQLVSQAGVFSDQSPSPPCARGCIGFFRGQLLQRFEIVASRAPVPRNGLISERKRETSSTSACARSRFDQKSGRGHARFELC